MSTAPWSHSRVALFEQCPLAYRYRYLEEVPAAFTTIEQHLGQAVHETLERAYAALGGAAPAGSPPPATLPAGSPPPAEVAPVDAAWMAAAFERAWGSTDPASLRIVKRGATAGEYRARGRAMVAAFHDRVFAVDTSETVALEQRFQLALDERRAWAGIIDRLARLPDGQLRVVDYKTGSTIPNPATDRQLASYALHVLAAYRVGRVELCLEGLRTGNTLTAPFAAGQVDATRQGLLASIAEIEAATTWPARPSTLCDWCGFCVICPEASGRTRPARGRNRW